MIIYAIVAESKRFGTAETIFSSTSESSAGDALMSLGVNSEYDFWGTEYNYDNCPMCGLLLSEHGQTTEIDTLETCIEFDHTGDY